MKLYEFPKSTAASLKKPLRFYVLLQEYKCNVSCIDYRSETVVFSIHLNLMRVSFLAFNRASVYDYSSRASKHDFLYLSVVSALFFAFLL